MPIPIYLTGFEQVLVNLGHGNKLPLGRPYIELGEYHVHFQRKESVPFHLAVLVGIAPLIVAPHEAEACESVEAGDGLVGVRPL